MQIRRSIMIYLPNPPFYFHPESEIWAKIFQSHAKSKIRAQKQMNPQSAAISGSGNPLKSLFESEIRAKIFSKSALLLPIHPLCDYMSGKMGQISIIAVNVPNYHLLPQKF